MEKVKVKVTRITTGHVYIDSGYYGKDYKAMEKMMEIEYGDAESFEDYMIFAKELEEKFIFEIVEDK